MTIDERELVLQQEVSVGEEYKQTWNKLVQPFFDAKQRDLYFAFRECSVEDSDRMKEIIHQSKSLDALRDEFQHYINTGELAKQELSKRKD